jgi:sec-independent protein translocase protein TatC
VKLADKEMTFWEHLDELRSRLIRAAFYVLLSAVAGWYTYPFINHTLVAPAHSVFSHYHIPWVYTTFTGPFFLQFQVALVTGIIYALPLLTSELWGFVRPALLPHERKWVYFVAPLSIAFFMLGVLAGYLVMTPAVTWFLSYLPKDQTVLQNAGDFILFECKCILAFGIVFQLPVVLMFLAMVGVVRSEMLRHSWKYAVCILTLVAAVVTPSNDPVTMTAMAVPLVLLYGLSIFLVQFTERMCGRGKPYGSHADLQDDLPERHTRSMSAPSAASAELPASSTGTEKPEEPSNPSLNSG